MTSQPDPQFLAAIQKISQNKFKIEAFLSALCIAAWFIGGPALITAALLVALAIFYFLSAYLPPSDAPPAKDKNFNLLTLILPKASSISGAVGLTGLAFMKMNSEGWVQMLLIAAVSLIIASVLLLFVLANTRKSDFFIYFIRSAFLALVTGYFVIPHVPGMQP